MRGQYVYCLRSVTSNSQFVISLALHCLGQDASGQPALLVEGVELDAGGVLADPARDLQPEFALVRFVQLAEKRAVLDALQTVVQAGIGDLCAYAIMRDVVD